MWGAQEKSEGAHQKIFGWRFAPALCPPTYKLLPTPLVLRKDEHQAKNALLRLMGPNRGRRDIVDKDVLDPELKLGDAMNRCR